MLTHEFVRNQAVHVAKRVHVWAVVGKQIAVPVAENRIDLLAILACDLRVCETINRVRSADIDQRLHDQCHFYDLLRKRDCRYIL